jgi:hypothetical protein
MSRDVAWGDEDTAAAIVAAEARARAVELSKDVAQHDGDIRTLQAQVAEMRVEWRSFRTALAWALSIMGTLVSTGLAAALAKLYGGH